MASIGSRSLDAIAAAAVGRAPDLAVAFVSQVRGIAGYGIDVIDDAELESAARRSIDLLIRRIAGGATDVDIAASSAAIGRARVDLGIPLDSLMEAVGLDVRLVWGALAEEAESREMPVLVEGAGIVWEAVERHASATLGGYEERRLELVRAREDEEGEWLMRLVDTAGQDAETLRTAARVLGFGLDRDFVVVAGRAGTIDDLDRSLRDRGLRTVFLKARDSHLIVVQLPTGAPDAERIWFDGVGCVFSAPVHGLESVPRQVDLTRDAVAAMPDLNGPRSIRSAWFELAAHALGGRRRDVAEDVLGPVRSLSRVEADRLVETVRVFIEHGSVQEAARALYCHRNTVFTRLQRFRDVSGFDPAVPADCSVIRLALLCDVVDDRSSAHDPRR